MSSGTCSHRIIGTYVQIFHSNTTATKANTVGMIHVSNVYHDQYYLLTSCVLRFNLRKQWCWWKVSYVLYPIYVCYPEYSTHLSVFSNLPTDYGNSPHCGLWRGLFQQWMPKVCRWWNCLCQNLGSNGSAKASCYLDGRFGVTQACSMYRRCWHTIMAH